MHNNKLTRSTTSRKNMLSLLLMISLATIFLSSLLTLAYATNQGSNGGGPAGILWVSNDGVNFVAVEFHYDVLPGTHLWIKVCNIPEEIDSGQVLIMVSNPGSSWQLVSYGGENRCTDPFEWIAPNAPYCTTYTVHYKDADGDPTHTYIAQGTVMNTGHLHIVPEFALGTIMPIASTLLGLVLYSNYRRK